MSNHSEDLERQEESASRFLLPESIEYPAAHGCTDAFHDPTEFTLPLDDKLIADACAEYLDWLTRNDISLSLLLWAMEQYEKMPEEERSRFLEMYWKYMGINPF